MQILSEVHEPSERRLNKINRLEELKNVELGEKIGYKKGFEDARKQFERPHGEWIPCSERLPKKNELVLVSFKTGEVQLCEYLDDGSNNPWVSFIDGCCAWNNAVNAWMPLPEPYQKEGEAE